MHEPTRVVRHRALVGSIVGERCTFYGVWRARRDDVQHERVITRGHDNGERQSGHRGERHRKYGRGDASG